MSHASFSQIQAELQSGTASCEEVVGSFLEAIEAGKELNAFVEVYAQEALARAKELDAKRSSGKPLGKLHGMVIALKDNICYAGHGLTASSKILENFESLYSATAVERLLAEDAIIIGRTGCDEFAMGSSNETSIYGPVLNALDKTKVPGGSSGGSAVAVQAGMCHASLGSDTGGSIRQPAAFCGIVGMKPTYGRISRHGLIAFASTHDQIGPFCNSIEDAALLMEVMAGMDEYDCTASDEPVGNYSAGLSDSEQKRIAYFPAFVEHEGCDPEIKASFDDLVGSLKDQGHTVEPVAFDLIDYLIPAYYVMATAEASSNLARYDGIHYGYRSESGANMEEVYRKSRSEGFGKEVKNRIMLGTFVLSSGYYDAYYNKAQKTRRMVYDRVQEIFQDFDLILTPTTPTTAFGFNAKQDPVEMYLSDIFTVLANLSGEPAISLPMYKDAQGMPIGMQLMAPAFQEGKLLAFSKRLMELATG